MSDEQAASDDTLLDVEKMLSAALKRADAHLEGVVRSHQRAFTEALPDKGVVESKESDVSDRDGGQGRKQRDVEGLDARLKEALSQLGVQVPEGGDVVARLEEELGTLEGSIDRTQILMEVNPFVSKEFGGALGKMGARCESLKKTLDLARRRVRLGVVMQGLKGVRAVQAELREMKARVMRHWVHFCRYCATPQPGMSG